MYLENVQMRVCDLCRNTDVKATEYLFVLRKMYETHPTGPRPGMIPAEDRIDLCEECANKFHQEMRARKKYLKEDRGPSSYLLYILGELPAVYYESFKTLGKVPPWKG